MPTNKMTDSEALAVLHNHASGLGNARQSGGIDLSAKACKKVSADLLAARAHLASRLRAADELAVAAEGYRKGYPGCVVFDFDKAPQLLAAIAAYRSLDNGGDDRG